MSQPIIDMTPDNCSINYQIPYHFIMTYSPYASIWFYLYALLFVYEQGAGQMTCHHFAIIHHQFWNTVLQMYLCILYRPVAHLPMFGFQIGGLTRTWGLNAIELWIFWVWIMFAVFLTIVHIFYARVYMISRMIVLIRYRTLVRVCSYVFPLTVLVSIGCGSSILLIFLSTPFVAQIKTNAFLKYNNRVIFCPDFAIIDLSMWQTILPNAIAFFGILILFLVMVFFSTASLFVLSRKSHSASNKTHKTQQVLMKSFLIQVVTYTIFLFLPFLACVVLALVDRLVNEAIYTAIICLAHQGVITIIVFAIFIPDSPATHEKVSIAQFVQWMWASLKWIVCCGMFTKRPMPRLVQSRTKLDAFGKIPSGISQWVTSSDGSYSTCDSVDGEKYSTNYCYLMLIPGKNVTCPDLKKGDPMQIRLRLALCIPESCNSHDIVEMFNSMSSLPVTACHTFCVKEPSNFHPIWLWTFLFFITVMIILSSYASYIEYFNFDTFSSSSNSLKFKFLQCFSLIANFKSILKIEKEKEDRLKGIDFIKICSMLWVISSHSSVNFAFSDTVKPLFDARRYFINHVVFFEGIYAVDTFMMIAGTLLGFKIFKDPNVIKISATTSKFWLKLIMYRYIRLMSPLLPFIPVIIFSSKFIRGPTLSSLFNIVDSQSESCIENWPQNVFMIQNWIKPTENCYPTAWYVASDFQFYLFSPLIIIPLIKSQHQGLKVSAGLVIFSVLWTFYIFWKNNLPPTHYGFGSIEDFMYKLHQQSFPRTLTFVMGILLGRSLALFSNPIRNVKENTGKFWMAAIFSAFLSIYGKLWAVKDIGEPELSPLLSAVHYMVLRFLWNIWVVWMIYACQHNLGSTVTQIINSIYWQPLGRICYCMYLLHWWMIYIVFNLSDSTIRFVSVWKLIFGITIPNFLLCLPLALFWSALLEVPVKKLRELYEKESNV